MRKLIAAIMVAGATLVAGSALAADFPYDPPVIEIPDVDYGVQGSFYLRGSAAGNYLWSKEAQGYDCQCTLTTTSFDKGGYGYSVGAGFGYETGSGLRFDATIDYLDNDGASLTKTAAPVAGKYTLRLRSAVALANVYYDFSFANGGFGSGYSAAGGMFAYVGAGAGAAFNNSDVASPAANPIVSGKNTSFAAAAMVGVGYDFGAFTADVGYRGIYIAELNNGAPVPQYVSSANNWVHEIRSSLRYRFN